MFNRKVSSTLSCLIVLLILLGFGSTAYSGTKVGYINWQRLVNESNLGKLAVKEIEKLAQKRQIVINQKIKKINEIKIDLQTPVDKSKETARKDKIDELNNLIKSYNRMKADAQEEINKERKEMVAMILKKADEPLKKVAKKRKFTMVITDSKVIGYLDPSVDITDAVLKEMNKK